MRWPRWPSYSEADRNALSACLTQDNWSRGRIISRFEGEFAAYCGRRHGLLVNSATEGLRLVFRALGVGPGDEVILPGLTWPSTAFAPLACGATVVLVDIEPDTYAISPDAVRKAITPRTRAIVPVHLYCSTADIEALQDIARSCAAHLVEDAAQVHGARYAGRALGAFGVAGVFSFHEKKLLPCGEGGCIVTDDDGLYQELFALRDHGFSLMGGEASRCSGHSRISSFEAAILSSRLKGLDSLIAAEEQTANWLIERLQRTTSIQCLRRRAEVEPQTYYSFCFRVTPGATAARMRERLRAALGGTFSSTYPPLSTRSFFNPDAEPELKGRVREEPLPVCKLAFEQSVRFPHQYLLADRDTLERMVSLMEEEARIR